MLPVIEFRNVTKKFGAATALDGVSLKIMSGSVFGLIGPNGAGKTTAINVIAGLLKQDHGEVTLNTGAPEELGVVPQEIALYGELTVADNLRFFADIHHGIDREKRIAEVMEFSQIGEHRHKRVAELSGGIRRRLNIAVGLINDPRVILMDEPTVGVDPQARGFILDQIRALRGDGKTILYTTHYLEEAEKICDEIAIIDHGKVIAHGALKELLPRQSEITVTFDDNPAAMRSLSERCGCISYENGSVKISSDDLNAALLAIADACRSGKLKVLAMRVSKPSLEELFIKLTGRSLRE